MPLDLVTNPVLDYKFQRAFKSMMTKGENMSKHAKSKGIGLVEKPMMMPMAPKMGKDEMMYRAKDDMETMRRAEEIKMDPKRHGMVKKMAVEHALMLKKIGGK